MEQLTVPLAGKLDEPLAELCSGREFTDSLRVPVIVYAAGDSLADVARHVVQAGGTVRHHLDLLGALAVWLPIASVERLASLASVDFLELEQKFTTA